MQLPPGIYDPPYRINNENSQVTLSPVHVSGLMMHIDPILHMLSVPKMDSRWRPSLQRTLLPSTDVRLCLLYIGFTHPCQQATVWICKVLSYSLQGGSARHAWQELC